VEVDGVLLNLLAWIWVLAVGFCGFLLGFDLWGVAVALNGGSWWLSRVETPSVLWLSWLSRVQWCECDREGMK
jgi:hypothetical protein